MEAEESLHTHTAIIWKLEADKLEK